MLCMKQTTQKSTFSHKNEKEAQMIIDAHTHLPVYKGIALRKDRKTPAKADTEQDRKMRGHLRFHTGKRNRQYE